MASTTRNAKKGVSLAKGPVALLGLAMLAYGVLSFIFGGNSWTTDPPGGDVTGDTFLRVEGNGWTNLLWIAGGTLLLLGSKFHWGAKTTALVVGLALGAASVISMFDGWDRGDVLGIFATNSWTTLVLGAASAYLLISALLPRVGRKDRHEKEDRHVERTQAEPVHEHREVVREREVVPPPATATHRDGLTDEPLGSRGEPAPGREAGGRFDRTGDRVVDADADRTRHP